MSKKIIGVHQAAGTQVEEIEGGRPIRQADMGWVAYAGATQRGTVGELTRLRTPTDAKMQIGGIISESLLPDAIYDFLEHSEGAGGILLVRVTDGNELPAEMTIYQRKLDPTPLGKLQAKNGGRWGGAESYKFAEVALVGDIAETTVDTAIVMKVDEWKGAVLTLDGVANKAYTVISNDAAGVLHVAADQKMATDLAASADPTIKGYHLALSSGASYLAVRIEDGDNDPVGRFSLAVYLDGSPDFVIRWGDLSTDPDDEFYWVTKINKDPSNYYVFAVDDWNGADVADTRPAAMWGEWTTLNQTSLIVKPYAMVIDGSGNPTITLGAMTSKTIEQVITLTMTGAAAFDASSDILGDLGSGTFGAPFSSDGLWTPTITIAAGTSPMVAAEKLFVYVKPLPHNGLVGGYVFPAKHALARKKYRITSNTYDTINVAPSSKMSTDVAPVAGVRATGQIQCVAKASLIDGDKFTLPDGSISVDFVFDVTGAHVPVGGYTSTVIRLDVSAATTNQDVAVIVRTAIEAMPASFKVGTTAAPIAGLLLLRNELYSTAGNVAIVETVADVGFTATGMSGGVASSEQQFSVDYPRRMHGGRDGVSELTDAHYEAAWDPDTTEFKKIRGKVLGLVKFATPGITAPTVQQACQALANSMLMQHRMEIPDNILTEIDADDFVTNTVGHSSHSVTDFPSFVYRSDRQKPTKLKLVSATGMIHGIEAAYARKFKGYHQPAAGVDAKLPAIKELPTGEKMLDEEFLNPRGINVIKPYGAGFVQWGARTLQDNELEWIFSHHRALMSHYERVMLDSYDWIIFGIQTPTQRDSLIAGLTEYFNNEWAIGALDRLLAQQNSFTIKIDAENNTGATVAAGDLYADIGLNLANIVEKFKIRIGKNGVNKTAA
jgi:hypothetical protein